MDMAEQVDSISKKRRKVIEWSERTVEDCLKDLVILCENVTDGMDSRYATSVSEAAIYWDVVYIHQTSYPWYKD